MNALSLLQYELSLGSIPTGSRKLDEAMGNGIRFGTITEFAGRTETGKTQLIFQLMFNTILPKPLGVIDGEAVYISTRPKSFCPERIYPMADHQVEIWRNKHENSPAAAKLFTRDLALSKILYQHVNSLPDLIQTVFYLDKLVKKSNNNIRLIAIDSYSMLLRGLEPMEQIRIDYEMLGVLESIAIDHECAVILTNTMTPEITESLGDSVAQMKPTLGYSHHHRIHQRIVLTKDARRNIIAGVQKTVTEGPSVVALKFTKHGITDAY